MLRDELKEITMRAMDQKEYDDVVKLMKHAANSGRCTIEVLDISYTVITKLDSEGIFVDGGMYSDEGTKYILSWM